MASPHVLHDATLVDAVLKLELDMVLIAAAMVSEMCYTWLR